MSAFEHWLAANAPLIGKHRDGAFSASFHKFKDCWDTAVRSIAPDLAASGHNLCMGCGAIFPRADTCPICNQPSVGGS